jgi:hypothetical protein
MSLDKAIKHGKEKRKPYRKAKAVDGQCRNHGNCEFCKDNRLYQSNKAEEEADAKMEDYVFESSVVPEGYDPQA